MATIIYPSPIFGPVHSRRLGLSLGINVCPPDGKICSFDCIYCECGFNADFRPKSKMPSRGLIARRLEETLLEMRKAGKLPDTMTFSGNGEPTGHPDFPGIVDDTLALRAKYCPATQVSVLTNATRITKPEIFESLLKVDNALLKLDTVDPDYIALVDRPNGHYRIEEILERMKAFGPRAIIQSMFLRGSFEGRSVDNTTERYVGPWLKAIGEIRPKLVTIYTIARETPDHDLRKAPAESLDAIADRVRALGIAAQVSY